MWRLTIAYYLGVGLPVALWAITEHIGGQFAGNHLSPLFAMTLGWILPSAFFMSCVGTAVETLAAKSYSTACLVSSPRRWPMFVLGVLTTFTVVVGTYSTALVADWLVVPNLPFNKEQRLLFVIGLIIACGSVFAVSPLWLVAYRYRKFSLVTSAARVRLWRGWPPD